MRKKTLRLITEAVPFAIGACSSVITGKMLKAHIPENEVEKISQKVLMKIGVYGIEAAVGKLASDAIKPDIDTLYDVLEPFFEDDPEESTVTVQGKVQGKEEKDVTSG